MHPVTGQVAELCADLSHDPDLNPADAAFFAGLGDELSEPLRLAVVGRIKTGKSTLVNALIGRRTAATAAGECTRIVTEYRFGEPDRAEAVLKDGTVHRLPFADPTEGQLPGNLDLGDGRGLDAGQVDHITVWLSAGSLRPLILVDTPGLSSGSIQDETNAPVDAEASARAASTADAVVFCFRDSERAEEIRFLQQFRDACGAFQAFGVNAIGVLCQADLVGQDPVSDAGRLAHRMATEHRHLVSDVIPVSGLLAETARTGQVDEGIARRLAELDPADRLTAFLPDTTRPRSTSERPTSSGADELDGLLGPWGLRNGRAHSADAATLIAWLDAVSGVAALEERIGQLLPAAPVLKAMRVLAQVQQRARNSSQAVRLGGMIERASLGPAAWALNALQVWQLLVQARPTSEALPELWSAIVHGPDAWLTANDQAASNRAREALAAATFALEPAEARAWRTLARAYQVT